MTNHLAEIKKCLWKSKTSRDEFWRDYYLREANRIRREYDKLMGVK